MSSSSSRSVKLLPALLVGVLAVSCSSSDDATGTGTTDGKSASASAAEPGATAANSSDGSTSGDPLKISLVIPGNLGDKSFFDSAQRGLDEAAAEYGVETTTVELGADPANYEPGLVDVALDTDSYDIIIAPTFSMAEALAKVAPQYPDKRFMTFDYIMDYETCECGNVYSIAYQQNVSGYLAGVYAASMTTETSVPGINDQTVIGALGAVDIGPIVDTFVGFEAGAKSVNPDTEVLIQYAGAFDDPAKGKEITLALFGQGADIVFQVAGGTGQGTFEAASEEGLWAIGIDSDQSLLLQETAPDQAAVILTSALKNVDVSLVRAIGLHLDGTLKYGTAESLGLEEDGVGIVRNQNFLDHTPQSVIDALDEAEAGILAGDIVVPSAFD